jgi:hypothetical protein
MRNFLVLLFFFQNGIICSQIFKGVIKYNTVKFIPVEYATILNKTNYNYTFSDSLGNFTISAKINDTLEINNLNTERTNYIINKSSDTIIITQQVNLLNEVIIDSETNKYYNLEGENFYGLSTVNNYAIKVKNYDNEENNLLKKIIIPIKFKANFKNSGKLKIQFVKNLNDNSFSKPIFITVPDIKKNSEIIIDITEDVASKFNSYFFIIIERIIENRSFKKNESLSVNPFFFYNENSNDANFYIQNKFNKKWIKLDNDTFGINPKITYKLVY